MSHRVITLSPDLKRLRDEGYNIEVKHAHLLVHDVPYVNSVREISRGILVAPLSLAGDRTAAPPNHMLHFIGEHPCDHEGNIITAIKHSSERKALAEGIIVDHWFSGIHATKINYPDYYEKIKNYVLIIESPAQAIDYRVTAKTFQVIESGDPDISFHYLDANSSRAGIEVISAKLQNQRVAIIGLGGTGSYVLDFVAKTPVKEIHLFDGDGFLSHNAFRAPGAASLATLQVQPTKVGYLHGVYSQMHKYIIPHEYYLEASNLEELAEMHFVFLCVDDGPSKRSIVQKLIESCIPFVDVGIGIEEVDGLLTGGVRLTTVTAENNAHVAERISFADAGANEYNTNVQIAELNALNASFAVIKWKKIFGFYHDLGKEHNMTYDINVNKIINDETHS